MQTTHWTIVLQARDGDSHVRQASLAALCETYWQPLYAYVRRRGYRPEDAQDLVQEFFAKFLERNFLKNVSRDKGRFRNFLLASLNHFLANEWNKKTAKKRGGGLMFFSLDVPEAERKLPDLAAPQCSPEDIYRREWALALLSRAYERLKDETDSKAARERFDIVKGYLVASATRIPYAQLEAETGVAAGTLKVWVHRLRQRYGELIRDEIRQTVCEESDVDEELRELLAALSV